MIYFYFSKSFEPTLNELRGYLIELLSLHDVDHNHNNINGKPWDFLFLFFSNVYFSLVHE